MWTTVWKMLPYRDLTPQQLRENQVFFFFQKAVIDSVLEITFNGVYAGRGFPLLVL